MTEERIIAYLLEELSEAERERWEEEAFDADEWPAEIALAEETLIDAYLRGELAPAQRENFEQKYLSTPAREEKLVTARALLRHLDERQKTGAVEGKISWAESWRGFWKGWRLSFAALALIALSVGLWWRLNAPQKPQTFASVQLALSSETRGTGGAETPKVKLNGADALRVALPVPANYAAPGYHAELQTATEAVKLAAAAPQNGLVKIVIPAARIPRGQYALQLHAIDANGKETRIPGNYYFDIE
jgi:hypothetical protein